MKTLKYFSVILFLIVGINSIDGQVNKTETINEGSINDQFEFLFRKSGNFKGTNGQSYEAVNRRLLQVLQSHTIDSLQTIRKKLEQTNRTVKAQQNEINSLKTNLINTQNSLDKTNVEKNNMNLLGFQLSKISYNIAMWLIVAALLVMLLVFIFKFKNSNAVTKAAKKSLIEIEEEFEEHRRTALEREQKVRRQLQDELNKQKGAN